ncbi:MAG: M20/M25/M40 family metallo-hydrolase [Bryobacteraceae bacterium]
MRVCVCALALVCGGSLWAQRVGERARRHLADLIRLETVNPPGNETLAARYLERVAREEGIACELLGSDPDRLNFVARLPGSGKRRPLLLMAHTDVVPAERAQWSVDPFAGLVRDGRIYGRGAQDDKGLLAAELAVLVELKRRGVTLERDVILMAEADEEAGSTGIQWLIANAWPKIQAEFALNEGGTIAQFASGTRIYQVQTAEKIPTRAVLRARGTAGHASLPRADNPVLAVARALVNLADADQPVSLNSTTRRYFAALAKVKEYRWLAPLLPRLANARTAVMAANEIRWREPELDAQLRTTVAPTMLRAGVKINMIPNAAEAEVDIRRLPDETAAEVFARLRRLVNDSAVEVLPAPGQEMPATEPSATDTALYRAMEKAFLAATPGALVVPCMQRGATDAAFLRAKGMQVYGVPLFQRDDDADRAHGNDERISLANLEAGTELLWNIVTTVR